MWIILGKLGAPPQPCLGCGMGKRCCRPTRAVSVSAGAQRAKRGTAAPVPPLDTRPPPSARCCCRLVAEARNCSAAASAAVALWPNCGTAARRLRAGSGPSGAPSAAGAGAVPGSSVGARRARVSAAAGERQDRGGHAEDAVVRSSPGDAIDCDGLRLAWAVSAWPPSPHSVGAKRDRRSAYLLWTGAAEAGEARERWRTAKQLELQKRKGEEKEKEVSELAKSPGSAKTESCGESWAFGALSPLSCVLVPPLPSHPWPPVFPTLL
ncbi:uncharacterized protein ACIBXB_001957 [Morphnus guianensis]